MKWEGEHPDGISERTSGEGRGSTERSSFDIRPFLDSFFSVFAPRDFVERPIWHEAPPRDERE